jgi:hypothetical protein
MVARIALPFRAHPAAQRRWFYYGFESTPQQRADLTETAFSGYDVGSDVGTTPVPKYLSVAAVTGHEESAGEAAAVASR